MAAEHQQQSVKAGSSRFTVTYGQLRQYMKDQGGHGAMRLAPAMATSTMPGADVAGGAGATEAVPASEKGKAVLDLFPQQPGMPKASQERKEPKKAQLTMFYDGRMVVFDDFPAEEAEKLVKAAGSCNASRPSPVARQPCVPDMRIARKASLQRFLEKRKDRLVAGDSDPAASGSNKRVKDDDVLCLGVNPKLNLN
ncbi:hypothetical protein EJB05_30944 [Eragrostis curvula]|uniref:Protein TIFY n=1 Tax=Eragrostis curvula TaxID=38414 RepID=A0A5J9UCM5_9POAL|nr:hypothetical protein EJB05_30944 [Eragrostis curvula]